MAVKSETLKKYQEFIYGLLNSLNLLDYKEYPVSKKIAEYKLAPVISKVLLENKYITRKQEGSKFYYKALIKSKDVDPKDIVALIRKCNNYYYGRSSKKVVKEPVNNGILINMKSITEEFNKLGNATVKVVYRNKTNFTQCYDSAQKFAADVINGKIDPSKFEEHKIINSPRTELIKKVTGNGVVKSSDIEIVKNFQKVLVALSKEESSNNFTRRTANLSQNIKRCPPTAEGNLRKAQMVQELCQLYIDYKKIPSNRFAYLSVYKKMKENS
jgi:uncharacterized protein YbcI